jgi:hypothetical protein
MDSMKPTRGRLFTAAVVAAGAGALAAALAVSREGILEWWSLRRLGSEDPRIRLEALRRLGDVGSARAVPEIAGFLLAGGEDEKLAALEALGRIGPAAAGAVPVLVGLLPREKRGRMPPAFPRGLPQGSAPFHPHETAVDDALVRIGKPSIPCLLQTILDEGDFPSVTDVLQRLDGGLAALVDLLALEDVGSWRRARDALLAVPERSAPECAWAALRHRDEKVRVRALLVLVQLVDKRLAEEPALAGEILPALEEGCREPGELRRLALALDTLLALDPGEAMALAATLRHEDRRRILFSARAASRVEVDTEALRRLEKEIRAQLRPTRDPAGSPP